MALRAIARQLTDEAWQFPVRILDSAPFPATQLLTRRLVEVELRHCDLRAGYGPDDWPAAFTAMELAEPMRSSARTGSAGCVLDVPQQPVRGRIRDPPKYCRKFFRTGPLRARPAGRRHRRPEFCASSPPKIWFASRSSRCRMPVDSASRGPSTGCGDRPRLLQAGDREPFRRRALPEPGDLGGNRTTSSGSVPPAVELSDGPLMGAARVLGGDETLKVVRIVHHRLPSGVSLPALSCHEILHVALTRDCASS